MTIDIQRNMSERERLDKTLTTLRTLSGTLRDQCSLIDPVFIVAGNPGDYSGANYLTVPDFGRSYFITGMTSVRDGLIELRCHVDVLTSFKTSIRACTGIVSRQAGEWNLYLNDGSLRAYHDPSVYTVPFSAGFAGSSFVLAVAGG